MIGIQPITKTLSIEEQEQVFAHYGVECYKSILSPLRSEGKPSFKIKLGDEGELFWVDFAYKSGSLVDFVMEVEGCSYPTAKLIIYEILEGKKESSNSLNKIKIANEANKEKINYNAIPYTAGFRKFELDYWAIRGINESQLNINNVFPLHMLTANDKFINTSTQLLPKFYYLLSDSIFKVYSPLDIPSRKWLSHDLINTLDLENKPNFNHKVLIIKSSKKDKMVFDNVGLEVDTASLLAEGIFSGLIKNLSNYDYYDHIYAYLDLDSSDKSNVYKGVERTLQLETLSKGRIKPLLLKEETRLKLINHGIKDDDEMYVNLGTEVYNNFTRKFITNKLK